MAPARDFAELVNLIELAEIQLVSIGGITDPEQRLLTLRGIFYGTPWSKDFRAERSQIRNLGFTIFTGFGTPPDPRPMLTTSLFNDLQNSQDVTDGQFKIDLGHALIGMEARTNSISRELEIPTQGGTGLEIVTWLGDLGGGAANLAWHRSANARSATRSVNTVFIASGSDYGASINLEGDVAGYLIGAPATVTGGPAALTFPPGLSIVALFRGYLPINAAGRRNYFLRSRNFLTMVGGRFDAPPSNRLRNSSTVISGLATKIRDFAIVYMLQRYILGQGHPRQRIEDACKLLTGVAAEVAETSVKALEANIRSPRQAIRAQAPWLRPTPPAATCTSRLLQVAARERDATRSIKDTLEQGRRAAGEWLRELM